MIATPASTQASAEPHGAAIILETQHLTRKFGAFVAVNNISICLYEREILGVIGPNGAGKSTLFSCLTGDIATSSGSVMFRGREITHLAAERRAKLGIARSFQVPLIFADMTVLENVMVGALLRTRSTPVAKMRATQIIELVGLGHIRASRASQLGTPGRKRLEIARALATQPQVLLLDEVMAGLTPVEIKNAIPMIREIHRRGTALIVVEHVMEVIMSLAQRVVVMNHGSQIAIGPPDSVMRDPGVVSAYLGKRAAGRLMSAK